MSSSAREMRGRLNTKSCIQKVIHTRKYVKYAKGVYQEAKVAFACDLLYHIPISSYFIHSLYRREPTIDSNFNTHRVHHRKLVRFTLLLTVYTNLTPSKDQRISIESPGLYTDAGLARNHSHRLLLRTNGWWMRGMRHVTVLIHILILCVETKRHVSFFVTSGTLHSYLQIKCDSMKLLTDMKTKIKHAVDHAYKFDTGRSPDSIIHNVTQAQALLAKTTFIYLVRPIASHLQPTEHRHMVHRISTLAGVHVIHFDTP